MTVNSIHDRCNTTNRENPKLPMHSVERNINMFIAKNRHLITSLNRNKNHPLIRKYSHIPFNK